MSDMIWNGSYTLGDSQETQITAGTGIKVTTPAAGQIQISNDETVLYSSSSTSVVTSFTLSAKPSEFDRIRISGYVNGGRFCTEIPSDTGIDANIRFACTSYAPDSYGHPLQIYGASYTSTNGLTYTWYRETLRWFNQNTPGTVAGTTNEVKPVIYKIVGIRGN